MKSSLKKRIRRWLILARGKFSPPDLIGGGFFLLSFLCFIQITSGRVPAMEYDIPCLTHFLFKKPVFFQIIKNTLLEAL